MEFLRSFTKWIGRHPFVSILGIIICVGLTLFTLKVLERRQGSLTEPLKKGRVVDAVYGIGTVTALHSYSIKPGITQNLRSLFAREGDLVKKGGKLATIDQITYTAPFDGVISYVPFKVGENVFSQTPIMVLTDLKNRYLVVTLVQQGALRVRPGQKAYLSFDSLRQKKIVGTVASIYSYSGSFLARIDVSDLPPEILPDMTADVAIVIQELNDVLIIPIAAYENGHVWVKRSNGIPTSVDVKLGVTDEASAQLISGDVHENDQLIIRKKVGP